MSQAGTLSAGSIPPGTYVQTLTGNTGGAVSSDIAGNINVIGDGTTITIAGNPGTNTLTASFIGSIGAIDITGDTGTTVSGHINLTAGANGTPLFVGTSATAMRLNLFDPNQNAVFSDFAYHGIPGVSNTGMGYFCMNNSMSGDQNSAYGYAALKSLTSGAGNTGIGGSSLQLVSSGINNIGLGGGCPNTSTGSRNIGIGPTAGISHLGAESDNIYIANGGANLDSHTMRLGTSGNLDWQINRTFIAGINGVNIGSVASVLTMNVGGTDQIGTASILAGTGISVTPGANTITIAATGTTTLTYTNVNTTPYVVLTTDEFLSVDCSGGPITVQLPNAATSGRAYVIKDRTGSAATNNITVTTVGGAVNIDGAVTFVINTAYEAINIIGNGSSYEIY